MRYSKILEKDIGINHILANVAASLAVEGLNQSTKARRITTKYLNGDYTSEQAIYAIKLLYL